MELAFCASSFPLACDQYSALPHLPQSSTFTSSRIVHIHMIVCFNIQSVPMKNIYLTVKSFPRLSFR